MNLLHRIGKMGMKDESGGNQKDDEQESTKPGKISCDHGNAPNQFKEDGTDEKKSRRRHTMTGHILCRPFEISNLSYS
jgi:hypothetical protein